MRLRGHHLACLPGFTGHGYDPAFTARLADLAARYRSGEAVEIVAGPDDVCAPCPGRKGDACAQHPGAEAAIRAQDAAVLAALGLAPGDRTTCAQVTAALAAPATRRAVRDACGDCRWTAVCAWWRGDA